MINIFSSRSHINWRFWRCSECWSVQPSHQTLLQTGWSAGQGEMAPHTLWTNALRGWGVLFNTTILPEAEPSDWSLQPHLSQSGGDEISASVLGGRRRGWPNLTNRRTLPWLSPLHWIGERGRFVFLCQLPPAIRHIVRDYCNSLYHYNIDTVRHVGLTLVTSTSLREGLTVPHLAMHWRLWPDTAGLETLRLCLSSMLAATITPVGHIGLSRETMWGL